MLMLLVPGVGMGGGGSSTTLPLMEGLMISGGMYEGGF
jgi:hypothetical protein